MDWTTHAFREIAEKRRWSWLVKRGQFLMNALTNTGTVTTTFGNQIVTGVGTSWTAGLVGQQFRANLSVPIYTIVQVTSATQLVLDAPWGGATTSGSGYQIYNAYVTCPSDFQSFVSLWDPRNNWQLTTNITQEELNAWDAQRSNLGTSYVAAQCTYDSFNNPPLPMYEIWPHQTAQYVFPFLYISRPPDLSDPGASLPRFIRGDVVLEKALESAASWPGESKDTPNPYFNPNLAMQHAARAEKMIAELERQDDETYETDAWYAPQSLPFAEIPYGDSKWLQSHA